MEGLDTKSESVFLLCALWCQSTHCNLPKVAAIYAIKHVFNIPEPHCVCVSLALSLVHSLPLTLCLPLWLHFYLCVSLQIGSPLPLRRRIISPALRRSREEVGVYVDLFYPRTCPVSKRCRTQVLFLPRPAQCPIPPISRPHPTLCSLS